MSTHRYGNAAEWLMAAMSVVTLAAVVWQSVLTRQMADDVFVSNLQERQITACSAAIRAKGVLGQLRQSQAQVAEAGPALDPSAQSGLLVQRTAAASTLVDRDKIGKLPVKGGTPALDMQAAQARAAQVARASELSAALFELKIYSGPETSARIDELTGALADLVGVEGWDQGYAKMSLDEGSQTIDRVETLFAAVEAECRDAMLGEKRGLL